MGKIGGTELLIILIPLVIIPIITHWIAYKFGKAKGKIEAYKEEKK